MTGIDVQELNNFIDLAIYEDVRDGDHTSLACIPSDARSRAKLLVKEQGVLAGVELAEHIFRRMDSNVLFEKKISDGAPINFGDIAFEVECDSQTLLKAERLVLNLMQRMGGIATLSRQYQQAVADLPVTILDTRKTTPLLRFLEKWAVKIGGCSNYRYGLYDRIMLKDNHIDACGTIAKAVEKVTIYKQAKSLQHLPVTVEVRNLAELRETMSVGTGGKVNRIMLDNFELSTMQEAVKIIDKAFETEASGGVNLQTLRNIALTGVDFISVGALTHSARSMDLSLKIIK